MSAASPPAHAPGDLPGDLLGAEGAEALHAWATGATLFAFDFDGTLAPIVSEPEAARMPASTAQLLHELATLAHPDARVAVISGRERSDLLRRLPPLDYVVGNHGNEGLPDAESGPSAATLAEREHAICDAWIAQLKRGALLSPLLEGVMVEHKGRSLAAHYRQCAHPERARWTLMSHVERLRPAPHVIGGLLVLNLLPPGARTKREALHALMRHSGCRRALFVGDDLTDERVFEQAPAHWLGVRVAPCADTHAPYQVQGPEGVCRLLERLVSLRRPLRPAAGTDGAQCTASESS